MTLATLPLDAWRRICEESLSYMDAVDGGDEGGREESRSAALDLLRALFGGD